jgi:hypothetical protein
VSSRRVVSTHRRVHASRPASPRPPFDRAVGLVYLSIARVALHRASRLSTVPAREPATAA